MTSLESSAILRELAMLNAHVAGLTLELADVRTTLDIQCKRIVALQAEVDVLPAARRRRDAVRAPAPVPPDNGNGRNHR